MPPDCKYYMCYVILLVCEWIDSALYITGWTCIRNKYEMKVIMNNFIDIHKNNYLHPMIQSLNTEKNHDISRWKSKHWPWDSYTICVTEDYEHVHSPVIFLIMKLPKNSRLVTLAPRCGSLVELVTLPVYLIMSSPSA